MVKGVTAIPRLFRARVGVERGWLVKSFNWTFILEAKPAAMYLSVLTKRQQFNRTILQGFLVIAPAVGLVSLSRLVDNYMATSLSWAYAVLGIVELVVFVGVLWFLGILGVFYLVDIIAIGPNRHGATPVAKLAVKGVQMGRFRHVLRVGVEEQILTLDFKGGDFLLTVVGTARGLKSALKLAGVTAPEVT